MAEMGILANGANGKHSTQDTPNERLELLEGTIVTMSPIGSHHASCVKRLNRIFSQMLPTDVLISVQDPIVLSEYSEPQPDVALLRMRPDYYATSHPQAADVLLIIEVADSTIATDRVWKVPMYAAVGIGEVWLVDLVDERLLVYRQPLPAKRRYQEVNTLTKGDHIMVASLPNLTVSVDAILPPTTLHE